MRGPKPKYKSVPLTQAERARLYRLRKAEQLDAEASPQDVQAALLKPPRPGPRPTFPNMTKAEGRKLKRLTKLTLSQLKALADDP